MRILFTHRYFWPDTPPYAAMLRTIADGVADRRHEVHVFSSKPSYRHSASAATREMLGELLIRRTWVFSENRANPVIRMLNVLLYCAGLVVHVLRVRPDVVTASTFPPVLAAWSASLAARSIGARFIYHMQDIHPEVSKYSGGPLGRGLPFRLLTWLDNQTLRRASAIVVLSEDMADTLRRRQISNLPIRVINNFLLDSFDEVTLPPPSLRKSAGKRRVIFAGNLGRFQNLPVLTEGIARCFENHPELELFFLGDGAALPDLRARWDGHEQVKFGPFLPFAQARILIAEADVGLVSLTPNMYRVSYPSKVLTYLGLGLPVLALVEPNSSLARSITESGIGVIPDSNCPHDVSVALEKLLQRSGTRARVTQWHQENATAEKVLEHWRAILAQV